MSDQNADVELVAYMGNNKLVLYIILLIVFVMQKHLFSHVLMGMGLPRDAMI